MLKYTSEERMRERREERRERREKREERRKEGRRRGEARREENYKNMTYLSPLLRAPAQYNTMSTAA
jgi:hypothetical protein